MEETLEDLEDQLGKTLTETQLELAVERLISEGGYEAVAKAVLDRLKVDMSESEANLATDSRDQDLRGHISYLRRLVKFFCGLPIRVYGGANHETGKTISSDT